MSGVQMGQQRCESTRSILELFLRSQHSHIFRFVEYHHWMAPFMLWYNICFTYTGSFMDTVIVVTGWAFIIRFNQITDRLRLLHRNVRTSANISFDCRPFACHNHRHITTWSFANRGGWWRDASPTNYGHPQIVMRILLQQFRTSVTHLRRWSPNRFGCKSVNITPCYTNCCWSWMSSCRWSSSCAVPVICISFACNCSTLSTSEWVGRAFETTLHRLVLM